MSSKPNPSYPYQAPIDAYGNGGFRFAGMSHRGSILCLPDGIHGWEPAAPQALAPHDFVRVLAVLQPPGFVLLGTGESQVFPSRELRSAFEAAGIGLEPMTTGSACRTYNVLLAEGRPVAAALIATD
ncbi:MAG: Mth938-like domain-containing protein [Hyphomicrobiaceae bacterium]|nr:Mth938-like domain-containing protein [Hyphomicrobiaceae bacterium]